MSDSPVSKYLRTGEQAMAESAYARAEANFRCAVQLTPEDADARYRLAIALASQSKSDESLSEIQAALDLNPRIPSAHVFLASLFQRKGVFDKAIEALREAIRLEPGLSKAYVDLVHSKRIGLEDSQIVGALRDMALDPSRSATDKIAIGFALGKALNDLGDFASSIEQFDRANDTAWAAVGSRLQYSPEDEHRAIDLVIRHFDSAFFARHAGSGTGSELPVLVVGMIRSGTTLLDSILTAHPRIASAGEQLFWESESLRMLRRVYQGNVDHGFQAEVADRYRRLLRSFGPTAKRVIDKMPMNYLHVGLIHSAFPNARFIHVRRHPIDTCLSIYSTDFGLEPPRFAFNKAHIVHAYWEYCRLMDHWKCVLPGNRLFEVRYEDLVLRRDEVLPGLVDYLGLDWDDSVLHHERRSSEIVTPSRWQARQPIYTTSLDRWRNVEPWLGEFTSLSDLV
ncbi:MAG: sulfotransferase [Fimbriimonas sp.]|nr:sulfotransferase [Fimbriimonas sp.]